MGGGGWGGGGGDIDLSIKGLLTAALPRSGLEIFCFGFKAQLMEAVFYEDVCGQCVGVS